MSRILMCMVICSHAAAVVPEGAVERTRVGLIGVDMLTLKTDEAIQHADATGDVVRVSATAPNPRELPWIIRKFFSRSRFWSKPHGFFMAMRADNEQMEVRPYMLEKFSQGQEPNMREYARAAAELIADPLANPSDRDLGASFARPLATRFVTDSKLPEYVIDAAAKQVKSLLESYLPWRRIPGKSIKDVYSYFEKKWYNPVGKGLGLPPSSVVDIAHAVFATMLNAPVILRAIQSDPSTDIVDLLISIAPVEQVVRTCTKETDLGGLITDGKPCKPGSTIILFGLRSAVKDTRDIAYIFGSGTTKRRCVAEGELIRFARLVQEEVLKLRSP